MYDDTIVHLAAEAGKIMLENGGETYRVEQTIAMICASYGIKDAQSFVTPTVVMTSVTNDEKNTISVIKRVNSRTVNLEKVAMINNLSRYLSRNQLSVSSLRKELDLVKDSKPYSKKLTILSAGIVAGFFTLLFGGNIYDFPVAFMAGIIIQLLCNILGKFNVNGFFINVSGGAIAALIALFASNMSSVFNMDKIIIGSIMLLVPGLAITNAVRDTIAGDLLSGLSRTLEAIMTAASIAAGAGIAFKLWIYISGGVF